MVPSTSVPLPVSVTLTPFTTVWSGPAFAVGAVLTALTNTTIVSTPVAPRLSVTVSENASVVSTVMRGDVNVVDAAVGVFNVTAVPAVCSHL